MELQKNKWSVSDGKLWYRSLEFYDKNTGKKLDILFTSTGKFNPDVVGKKLFEKFIESGKQQFDRIHVTALLEHRSYIESLGLVNAHEVTPGGKYFLYAWRSDSKYNILDGPNIGSLKLGDSIKLHDYKLAPTFKIIDRDDQFTSIQYNKIKLSIPNDIIVVKV